MPGTAGPPSSGGARAAPRRLQFDGPGQCVMPGRQRPGRCLVAVSCTPDAFPLPPDTPPLPEPPDGIRFPALKSAPRCSTLSNAVVSLPCCRKSQQGLQSTGLILFFEAARSRQQQQCGMEFASGAAFAKAAGSESHRFKAPLSKMSQGRLLERIL